GGAIRRAGARLVVALRHRGERLPRPHAPLAPRRARAARGRGRARRRRRGGGRRPRGEGEARRRARRPHVPLARAARGSRPRALSRPAVRRDRQGAPDQRGSGQDADLPRDGDAEAALLRRSLTMECRDVLERVVLRLSGELTVRDERELAAHLAGCDACSAEAAKVAGAWETLDADPDAVPSERFMAETHALLEK